MNDSHFFPEYGLTVYRDGRIITRFGKLVTGTKCRIGYVRVYVTATDGKRKSLSAHRLLAMAFIPNPDNKPDVNHKDGNKENNSLDNLEWATRKENIAHAIGLGLRDKATEAMRKSARNKALKDLRAIGYTHQMLADAFNVSTPRIGELLK